MTDTNAKANDLLRRVVDSLQRERIPVLVLRAPGPERRPHLYSDDELSLLVPRNGRTAVRRVLECTDWIYQFADLGMWRAIPMSAYVYKRGPAVYAYSAIPAGPLPSRSLVALERALWRRAAMQNEGFFVPDAESLVVFLALQAQRPNELYHEVDREHLAHCAAYVRRWGEVWDIARKAHLESTVRRALGASETTTGHLEGRAPERDGSLLDGTIPGLVAAAAARLQRGIRPRRLSTVLAGTAIWTRIPVRARFAGVEVRCSPPVFVPADITEPLIDLTLSRLSMQQHAIVADIGTGCGAVAFALAHHHPHVEVHAADTSRRAIHWARRNRRRLGADRVLLYRGSLLAPLPVALRGRIDAAVANLPYYPPRDYVPAGAIGRSAIEGEGDDGLGLHRAMIRQAREFLRPSGFIVLQMFEWQWERLRAELRILGYTPEGSRGTGPFVVGWASYA